LELHHRFTVPVGVEEAWVTFNDIEGVAGCFPGATVTGADAESFTGTVKVKLGPIALVYTGTGTFVELDESAHRMVIDAKGKDKRGNGTAGAKVVATMTDAGGATEVDVSTDLSITGKAAQFGRGNVIKDVSDKLLGQFVSCLEQRLGGEAGEGPGAPTDALPEAKSPPIPPSGGAPPPVTAGDEGAAPAAPTVAQPAPAETAAADAPRPDPQAPAPAAAGGRRGAGEDDAIDLGVTVLPVLLRAYWKPAAAVLAAVVALLWWLLRRD
jgi:carbon monoxide dehydrogenase subunit G